MLNISKYHSAIVCCSVVATASLAGFVQSAQAAEQVVCPSVRAERGTILIAQTTNSSNTTGTNVSNTTGTNVSNTTGTNTSTSFSGGSPGGGFSPAVTSRASTISSRFGLAQSNYSRAAATLAQAETAQPTVAASPLPVRYGREAVGDMASCGCPNVEKKSPMKPESICSICSISKLFTSVAVMQLWEKGSLRLDDSLTALLPEYKINQQFIESVKSDTARSSNVDNSLW